MLKKLLARMSSKNKKKNAKGAPKKSAKPKPSAKKTPPKATQQGKSARPEKKVVKQVKKQVLTKKAAPKKPTVQAPVATKTPASKKSTQAKPIASTAPSAPVLKVILCGPHSVYWIPSETDVDPKILLDGLHPKEIELGKAISAPARRNEFMRARWLARRLTKVKEPLLRAKTGEPNWPQGMIGSITHKEGNVLVCKVTSESHYGVGLDIEKVAKISDGIESKICNPEESEMVDRVSALGRLSRKDVLAIIFTFKEALYKTYFPIGHKFFGFEDVTITEIAYERREIFGRMNIDTSVRSPKDHISMGFYNFIDYQGSRFVVTVAEERKPLIVDPGLKEELLTETGD